MSRNKYWAVCYGNTCRWAGPCKTASDAVWEAFGIHPNQFDAERITVREFPGNPKYMSLKKRNEFLDKLFARHKEKTGHKI